MVGHDWSVDIFNDQCSAALDSIVSKDPVKMISLFFYSHAVGNFENFNVRSSAVILSCSLDHKYESSL